MGGSKTVIEAPKPLPPDKSFEKYLQYQTNRENRLADRAEKQTSYDRARTEGREAAGGRGLEDYYSSLENQLSAGVIGFGDAKSQLENYISRYNLMTPGQTDVTDYPDPADPDAVPTVTSTTTTTTPASGQPGDDDYTPPSTTVTTQEDPDTTLQIPTTPPNYEWDTNWDEWANPQQYLDRLQDTYIGTGDDDTGILGTQRTRGVQAAYRDLLGREATEGELQQGLDDLQARVWEGAGTRGLRDSIKSGSEYSKKFNQSYLDNYYDTMFGPQTTDESGDRTGKRKYTFDANLLPSYRGDLADKTGINLPDFTDYFSEARTVKELEEGTQNIRDTRKYLYSAGLTALQGDIDKETTRIKNEGAKDIAKIQSDTNIITGALSGFWS
tara:strand:- start:1452 stop:2603 length:1152 start_codon:yes stop_codon:yes gene_type:complete